MYVPLVVGEGKERGRKGVRKREGGGREGETGREVETDGRAEMEEEKERAFPLSSL